MYDFLNSHASIMWGVAAGGVLFWLIATVQASRHPPICTYCKRKIAP